MNQRTFRRRFLRVGVACVLVTSSVFGARAVLAPSIEEFEDLSLTLHANLSDEELAVLLAMEVAEEILGIDIMDPAGNMVYQLNAPHPMGLHECVLEAKGDVASVLAAFPQGTYRVVAYAKGGTVIQGVAYLSHDLPARPTFSRSVEQAPAGGHDLVAQWNADGADRVHFEAEGEEFLLELTLPGHFNQFIVPAYLFAEDDQLQLGISSIAANGNRVERQLIVPVNH